MTDAVTVATNRTPIGNWRAYGAAAGPTKSCHETE